MNSASEFEELKTGVIIGGSVIGGVCILLTTALIALVLWNIKLSRRIKDLEPFLNFKLQRPKMVNEQKSARPSKHTIESTPPQNERRDLNPIALRSKASFDNGNFIFGEPNKMSNSLRSPDYLDQDSRFY